ncbi:MAG: hypothetical protein ACK5CA_17095 [Cyanobacteriota bacterium]|jgi:tRNA U34 5-methylaminomethyl-2-thiouridine-forming methyltransferase MnmC
MTDKTSLINRVNAIKEKRAFLVRLSGQTNLGILQLDISQALSELDDLLEDFKATFPEAA